MFSGRSHTRWPTVRGHGSVENDLSPYRSILEAVVRQGSGYESVADGVIRHQFDTIRDQCHRGRAPEDALAETFALVREAARRTIGLRPFDEQVLAGIALTRRNVVEMQTGEGKTLAAVMPACLQALPGKGVHVLTFNDYLARRDALWMGPVYAFLGLSVGFVQDNQSVTDRKNAYQSDVTYVTAREAGFDFLRMHLARDLESVAHRALHYAIVDEADSILIDEARVPLVIAGTRSATGTSPYRIAEVVRTLREDDHWETDENQRNVYLTDRGLRRVESQLACVDLHLPEQYRLLIEVNQALHAHVLLRRDVDYIVRRERIELVDDFTGRVVENRRWPDGLQAALEAKEGLPLSPVGRILGSITLQHFLQQYPRISGMTGTARSAATELKEMYDLDVVPIPTHRPNIRTDLPDRIFTHPEAKYRAIIDEVQRAHRAGRPVLLGTISVEESEDLSVRLGNVGIEHQVLNARNDEQEAGIISNAGAPGAVTISTNMAGRGADIRLGGADESGRDAALAAGGLYVIGTHRHESKRIDLQLRGRTGRQGDPGSTQFLVSLEDELLKRFGIDELIPTSIRPPYQDGPIDHPVIRRELDRVQRIIESQNREIRQNLFQYSTLVEKQRQTVQGWRQAVLEEKIECVLCSERAPDKYVQIAERFGNAYARKVERILTLAFIDSCWADHLDRVAEIREGIHLVAIGGVDPLQEFHRQIADAFLDMQQAIEDQIVSTFRDLPVTDDGVDLQDERLAGPSSTWTYLTNDRVMTDLQHMLFGHGNQTFAAGAVLMTWPVLVVWAAWRWFKNRKSKL